MMRFLFQRCSIVSYNNSSLAYFVYILNILFFSVVLFEFLLYILQIVIFSAYISFCLSSLFFRSQYVFFKFWQLFLQASLVSLPMSCSWKQTNIVFHSSGKKGVHFAVYFFACEMSAFLENSFGWGRLVVVVFCLFWWMFK